MQRVSGSIEGARCAVVLLLRRAAGGREQALCITLLRALAQAEDAVTRLLTP